MRELIALLRAAGLDPSAAELADALWLAGRTARAAAAGEPPGTPGTPEGSPPPEGPPQGPEPPREQAPVREEAAPEDPVSLYAPRARRAAGPEAEAGTPLGGGVPVRVPGAAALPRVLEVQRALRALQRHRPGVPPTRTVLDEQATAEASARALGLVIPVFRPQTRREATVRLVMDASPSMAVWQDMFEELRAVCERLGAFRDVRVSYLHRLADGRAVLARGPAAGSGERSGDQLRDPTGRALTMVVSDCAGPVWREGEAQRLLYRWAECAPCVVVQPLPQRLWGRSWLPTERGGLCRVEGGGGKLAFTPDRSRRPGRPAGRPAESAGGRAGGDGLVVPVLPPSAIALGRWARLVAGLGTGPVPAEVGRVFADHPAAPLPPPPAARPPRELVRRFRSSAAPRAVQLAVYLSAAPLTLPVMRLVQRTMLPDSEPSDLAEVLLSGLLRRTGDPGWYEFVPGVREVLLGPLGRDEAALVLKHSSEYVLAHFGRGVRNFPALAVTRLTGTPVAEADVRTGVPGEASGEAPVEGETPEPVPDGPVPQAFAEVSAQVVRRYLPEPPPPDREGAPPPAAPARDWAVRTARARLADGDERALYEAVTVLRRAVTVPAGPEDPPGEAECELAGALLRLWAVRRETDLLAEAERAARAAPGPPGRLALGRVLHERALAAAGEPDAGLLAAAEREFAAVGSDPAAGRELRLEGAVRRAESLILLSGLRDDTGALREARDTLEALAGQDAGVRLALGRVLLALAAHAPDPAEREELAALAARRLEAALATAPEEPEEPGSEARRRIRVELATALSYLPGRLEEAAAELARALTEPTGDPELRVAALVCLARVHRARYARDADPAALEEAAEAYGRARRLIPRDGDAYGELLPEWGDVLLERARATDGRPFASTAVRVLRESRAAVPRSDPRSARRLLRLAEGLRLRHAYEGDLVDLREAEHLLDLAVRQGRGPLERARGWREHGDVQREIHRHTGAAERLDRAADSYRRAWRAAMEADEEGCGVACGDAGAAVRLGAVVQGLRGEVLEALARPRAAVAAYRSALDLWNRAGVPPPEALTARLRALETDL
ncbi:SAV_2336 N-terminal domain-related protein [Streptomyces goshikiensis]|uniref:SAV_2336 N-terminal domain-related protein n=1 Tax=Streptomyces goshikiensis TaxID=1942 RepID=UPI00361DE3C8